MIDEESLADRRARMNLNTCQKAREIGDQPREKDPPAHIERMRQAMQPDGMESAVAENDLDHALCRGVSLKDNADITFDPCEHSSFLSPIHMLAAKEMRPHLFRDADAQIAFDFSFILPKKGSVRKNKEIAVIKTPAGNLCTCFG